MANVRIWGITTGVPALTDVMELQRTADGASLKATVAAIAAILPLPAAPGVDTEVLFNDATAIGAHAGLKYAKTTNTLTLGVASSATGVLKLAQASSAFLTTIQAGAALAARTYIWPTDFGSAGYVLTDAAGDGVLSWAAGGGGGTPGGSDTQVQFNDGGSAFGGDAAFTFDKATGKLTIHKFGSTGTPGDYTLTKSGFQVLNAAGDEILRIWATDPDVINDYNSANLYIGRNAGLAQPTDNVSAGFANVGVGDSALSSISTGSNNTAVGYLALESVTTGTDNIGLGRNAGQAITTGVDNTAFGTDAMQGPGGPITGGYNAAIGSGSLNSLSTGNYNTALGKFAAFFISTGESNVAIGPGAISRVTDGSRNTMVGCINSTDLFAAGYPAVVHGVDNTFVGFNSGPSSVDTSNAIAIGSGVDVSASNRAVIGNGSVADVYFGSETPAAKLHATTALLSSLSASQVVLTDASKNLVSGGTLGTAAFTASTAYDAAGAAAAVSALRAAADGTTFGLASFTANDFDATLGVISLDYTNAQKATASVPGFLTAADWSTFNSKQAALTLGTGVSTALAVNVGSAGAFVTFNGALGTPSSGTLTNATGLPAAGVVGTAAILGANTFTALQTHTIAAANTGVIASTGYSLTGSDATNMIDLAGTWNTSGTPTGLKLTITNTASNANSRMLDLTVGSQVVFYVRATGIMKAMYLTADSTSLTPTSVPGAVVDNTIDVGVSGGRYKNIFAGTSLSLVGANAQVVAIKQLSELLTIAAAATSTTTIQKPANSVILAVNVRVTTAVTCTSTFTVGDSTSATRFSTAAVSKALNSTDPGTKAGAYYNATAEGIIITPDTTPTDATGRVRVTIVYYDSTPPTS